MELSNWWHGFMQYDSTERLLYGLAALFSLWYLSALLLRSRGLDRKHWFHEWGEAGFTAVWLALIIRALLVEAYSIPSESMVPTLLVGDHLLVSKTTFGWPDPFGPGRLFQYRPVRRDEVVIFIPPNDPKVSYVKRCVGIPGDLVEVRDKVVYINGRPLDVPYSYGRLSAVAPGSVKALTKAYENYLARPAVMSLRERNDPDSPADYATTWLGPIQLPLGTYYLEAAAAFVRPYARIEDIRTAGSYEVEYKGGVEPVVPSQPNWARDHHEGNRDWFGPYRLAKDEYWMMGDNRDNSLDSRYFGPVKANELRGTPIVRYWPLDRLGLVH
ncbi:MAG: signal peptidase I [bacterium]